MAGLYRKPRNFGCRIAADYRRQELETVVLQNELLRVEVLAGKGTDIVEFLYKPLDLDFVWWTALGLRNPNLGLNTAPTPLATFLDYYEGGWQEILPNGGPPCTWRGAEFGQHGEVCNLPWDCAIATDSPERVAAVFSIRLAKMPLVLEKRLELRSGDPTLFITERLHNDSPVGVELMWGHHIALGPPFLAEGCRIELPAEVTVIPHPTSPAPGGRRVDETRRYRWPVAVSPKGHPVDLSRLPPRGEPSDIVYLTGFPEGVYRVLNPTRGVAFEVRWDAERMPYLWYWQEFGAIQDYPWYGRHYNIGLEPFTSYPTNGLPEAVANGSALRLGPGEQVTFALSIGVIPLRPAPDSVRTT